MSETTTPSVDFPRLLQSTTETVKALALLRSAYSKALDDIKEAGSEAPDLIEYYGSLLKMEELIGVETRNIAKLINSVKYGHLPEVYDRDGIKVLTNTNGDRCHITTDVLASILAENREAAHQWLRANGHGDIIMEYVWPGTLSSFAKTQIEETGADFPPESMIGVETRPKANLTPGKESPYRSIKRGGVGA
jgi:hypothetical protein